MNSDSKLNSGGLSRNLNNYKNKKQFKIMHQNIQSLNANNLYLLNFFRGMRI